MKKFYKLLIFIILPILILCNFTSSTYCSESVIFPADNVYSITPFQSVNGKQNFYNYSNLQDVYYTNFDITVTNGYLASVYGDFSSLNLPFGSTFFDLGQYYIDCFGIDIGYFTGRFEINKYTNSHFDISLHDYVWHKIDNIKVNPLKGYGGISFDIIPTYFFTMGFFPNVNRIWYQGSPFSIEYDIVLNNQYFYNQYFGFVANLKPIMGSKLANNGYMSNISHTLSIRCNLANNWGHTTLNNLYLSDFVQTQDSNWVIFNNEYSYSTDYVRSVGLYITPSSGNLFQYNNGMSLTGEFLRYNLILNYNVNNDDYLFLYSNTTNNDGLNSSAIIPNGSNDFYKSCEWWDIPTHLYNFLIYMVFDAPIISDFTRLAYVLIQFIVSVFEWIISLFTGFSNSFFIAIFVGFLVLMFLLKIIFKG